MDFIQYCLSSTNISAESAASLAKLFRTQELRKGTQLLEMGNNSKKVFFLEEGLARTFYMKDDKNITHLFFKENAITLPVESVFYNKPSPYGFELLEDSVVKIASYPAIESHLQGNTELENFVRSLLVDVVMLLSNRLYAIQFQSAQERYDALMEHYPSILLRAPLGHIASYLGITQQTLSVIRAAR